MKVNSKTIAVLGGALICSAAVLRFAMDRGPNQPTATYSQFLRQVRAGQVAAVVIEASKSGASNVTGKLKDGNVLRSVLPADYRDAMAAMQDQLVDVEIRDASLGWLPLLANATPFFLLLAVWMVLFYRLRNRVPPGRLG